MILTEKIVEKNNLIDKNGHCDVPEGYTVIGECAFYNCINLKSINLPNSITEIGGSAFYNCISLKSIELPKSITKIEEYAFYNCTSLELVKLPNLKSIKNKAFYDCTKLVSIKLPNNLEVIEGHVFDGCTSLPKIKVGKEILEMALKDNYFEQYRGLCFCFGEIVSELILKYKKSINLKIELPMFTQKNAMKYANGRDKGYWFDNSSDRRKFLEWMLSEIEKRNINDEILILRR